MTDLQNRGAGTRAAQGGMDGAVGGTLLPQELLQERAPRFPLMS